jgi:hypothetical protein
MLSIAGGRRGRAGGVDDLHQPVRLPARVTVMFTCALIACGVQQSQPLA